MAWVKIDDSFSQHPKVVKAGPLGMAMQIAALCYCNRNLTDGFVPRAIARSLLDWEIVDEAGAIHTLATTSGFSGNDVTSAFVISLLVDSGLWSEEAGGYQIHDYLDYQPSKAETLSTREKTKERVNQWRKRKSSSEAGTESNAVTNGGVTPAPVPVPGPLVSNNPPTEGPPNKQSDDAKSALEIYNTAARETGWPEAQRLTSARRASVLARLRDCGGIDGWRAAMDKAKASAFLTGNKGWLPGFDFFCQAKSFTKLMEGSYDDRAPRENPKPNGHDAQLRSIARVVEKRARLGERPAGSDDRPQHHAGADAGVAATAIDLAIPTFLRRI